MTQPIDIELTPNDVERFRAKQAPPNADGCRLWQASLDKGGYGQFRISHGKDRRTVKAHLVAWKIEVGGEFPEGLEPDHVCVNPQCTEPTHLEWVTHAENNRRRAERSTHCGTGRHRWDEQAPIQRQGTGRECRPCRNERKRIRFAKTGKR